MKKPQKQLLSVLFHLAVLACMVILFDLVNPLIGKMNLGERISSGKEQVKSGGKALSDKTGKGGGVPPPTGGTTMADLMAQKAEQQKKKAEELQKQKVEQQKKDE